MLEQTSAEGSERARAWKRFGDAWESRFGSLEEAARAYREAAAADSADPEVLERASELCAALGQADLAVAYARASVAIASEGSERAAALWRYALLCRRLGKLSEALGALRAAASADTLDPEPLALSVHLWRELGRAQDAARAATEAAERVRATDPGRALSLHALALGLEPESSERAEAHAAELAVNGLAEAAIAVRADAVRNTTDPDTRRSLLLAAAEQAELANRPDIAAGLLTRAFDAEPHVDLLYEPLDADLGGAHAPVERAIMLEEIAAIAQPEVQAAWLSRAARARLELPGDGAWETELRTRALELAPEDEDGLSAIREQASAQGNPRLLADALERAVVRGRWSAAEPQARALEELAALSEDALESPVRAAWAWARLQAQRPDNPAPPRQLARLAPALEEYRTRRKQLEDEHETARGEARERAARLLGELLRDDPERRRHAVGIYRELLESEPRGSGGRRRARAPLPAGGRRRQPDRRAGAPRRARDLARRPGAPPAPAGRARRAAGELLAGGGSLPARALGAALAPRGRPADAPRSQPAGQPGSPARSAGRRGRHGAAAPRAGARTDRARRRAGGRGQRR